MKIKCCLVTVLSMTELNGNNCVKWFAICLCNMYGKFSCAEIVHHLHGAFTNIQGKHHLKYKKITIYKRERFELTNYLMCFKGIHKYAVLIY